MIQTKDPYTPYGFGTNTTDYSKVKALVMAMEAILSAAQIQRVLRATECGGFEAGLKSLERVNHQIAVEKAKAGRDAAYMQGQIISLESEVKELKERAERTRQIYEAALTGARHD